MNIDERLKEYAALVGELQRQLNEKNEKIRRLTEMVDSAKEPEVYELGRNKLVIFNGGGLHQYLPMMVIA